VKIAWVTPFCCESAIGRVSASATAVLGARGHAVTIVRSEREPDDEGPHHPTAFPIVWAQRVSAADLDAQYDAVVLNFGDHYGFHAGVLNYLDAIPCIGIFHDFYLYNFFRGWLVLNGMGVDVRDQVISATYGPSALEFAAQAWQGEVSMQRIANEQPMIEWLAQRCGAALAHSRFYLERLTASCPGPVAVAPLCFEGVKVPPLKEGRRNEIVLTTVGLINPNKCADHVIEAIARSPALKQSCRYRLVGPISQHERQRLEAVCHETGFFNVDVVGPVHATTLAEELDRADILICLRKPVSEGASASAIEGMKAGRPLIVPQAGFYADLPDDLVFKVPKEFEARDVAQILERLVGQECLRTSFARRARAWAEATFTAEAYCDVLERLIEDFVSTRPLLQLSSRMGNELASIGIGPEDPSVARIAAIMSGLFTSSTTHKVPIGDNAVSIFQARG
jgi:glycosyltransferase involved in cell wall biosynthesis